VYGASSRFLGWVLVRTGLNGTPRTASPMGSGKAHGGLSSPEGQASAGSSTSLGFGVSNDTSVAQPRRSTLMTTDTPSPAETRYPGSDAVSPGEPPRDRQNALSRAESTPGGCSCRMTLGRTRWRQPLLLPEATRNSIHHSQIDYGPRRAPSTTSTSYCFERQRSQPSAEHQQLRPARAAGTQPPASSVQTEPFPRAAKQSARRLA
jgi:hypothetical protein